MTLLGTEIGIDLRHIGDMERITPLLDQFAKDLAKIPLQKEFTKINALKIPQEEKQKKIESLGLVALISSFRNMFDVSKKFIIDVTETTEITDELGEDLASVISAAGKLNAELVEQLSNLAKEMKVIPE